ncbi:MAG: hypothetical protein HY010_04885 [Acidobacteria bacterium]|nr:hypothetical protein [Acidobacteriota bacterium]
MAEWQRGSWKLYRIADTLEPVREGTGDLRSISDEVAVIRNGRVIRVETLDGKQLGSFSVKDEIWGYHAVLLGNAKLYLDDCKKARIVDFNGNVQLELHPRDVSDQGSRWSTDASVCDQGHNSSTDGRRILFDFATRKVPPLRHFLDSARTVTSLGWAEPEDNREEVRVVDTVTGKSCFSWHRSFPATYTQARSAAISPSGEFVAVTDGTTLSIYRLPKDCDSNTTIAK